MKFSRSTFALVLLNVAWLAAGSWFLARYFGARSVETRVQFVTNYVPVLKSARGTTPVTVVTNILAVTNDFRWAQLESEDYRTYITRLRDIGCPEQTIRDIVIADVDKMLAPRMQAASPHPRDLKYWQPVEQELSGDSTQKDALRQQRALDFEKREVIRELLGIDLVGERLRVQGQGDYFGERLGFLPEEKRARVRTVLDQFADSERVLLEQAAEDGKDQASSEDFSRLRREKDAAVGQLLTPEERTQYDLWFSQSAAAVRESVYGLNASEEEFMKLYHLRRGFAEKHGDNFGPWNLAWGDYEAQVRQTLGEDRYAEYTRAQDNDYREIMRVTSRFKLPSAVAAELYSYKQPIEEERAKVQSDPGLSPQQKDAAYRAIAGETQRVFKEKLGDKAFSYYSHRTANPWVRAAQ